MTSTDVGILSYFIPHLKALDEHTQNMSVVEVEPVYGVVSSYATS